MSVIGIVNGIAVYDPETRQVKDIEVADGELTFRISHPHAPEAFNYGRLEVRSGGQVVFTGFSGNVAQLVQVAVEESNATTPLTPAMERAAEAAESSEAATFVPKARPKRPQVPAAPAS